MKFLPANFGISTASGLVFFGEKISGTTYRPQGTKKRQDRGDREARRRNWRNAPEADVHTAGTVETCRL